MSSHSPNRHGPTGRFHPAAHPDSSFNQMRDERYGNYPHNPQTESTVTTGADNFSGASAGGGMAGIATGVAYADSNEGRLHPGGQRYNQYPDHHGGRDAYDNRSNISREGAIEGGTYTPGRVSPLPSGSDRSINGNSGYVHHQGPHGAHGAQGHYDDPYNRHRQGGFGESINPANIVDDGDDGFIPDPKRRSVLSLGRSSNHNSNGRDRSPAGIPLGAVGAAGAAGAGVAAAGGAFGSDAARSNGPVRISPAGSGIGDFGSAPLEKPLHLQEQKTRKKRLWIILSIVAILVIGGIAGGVAGGLLANKGDNESDKSPPGSASDDDKKNGDLDKDSTEIKALLNNKDLHKVFPGMDYTPWGTQYPLCLKYPPSQNNVTRDMAIISQLTNTVRLYGTDCNQTEMVLHAIDQLDLKNMKLWMGVWIDNNKTTVDRQLKQLYSVVGSGKHKSVIEGVIVGNEYLFHEDKTQTAMTTLINHIKDVKSHLTKLGLNIPVATSDLGAAWNSQLAKASDVVMSNVHPFFGGVPVAQAAGWTYTFWTENDVVLTKGTNKKQVISEVGWPTAGGNDCGEDVKTCPDKTSGSVAGYKQLNSFMGDWVCQALKNGTDYFWFEAFDEPWKVVYNEPGKEWEDKWGLFTPDRKLKPGITIPDCGGKTVG